MKICGISNSIWSSARIDLTKVKKELEAIKDRKVDITGAIESIKREITTSATMTNKRLTEAFYIGLERLEKTHKN